MENIAKKMGRPKADNPKQIQYCVRIDEATNSRLELYCAAQGITKGEAYRRGLELLLNRAGIRQGRQKTPQAYD